MKSHLPNMVPFARQRGANFNRTRGGKVLRVQSSFAPVLQRRLIPIPSTATVQPKGRSYVFSASRQWAVGAALTFAASLVLLGGIGSKFPFTNDEPLPLGDSMLLPDTGTLISFEEVGKHNSRNDCWVILNGEVYDVTKFIQLHPGGENSILRMAGKDATKVFAPIHPPDALASLPEEYHIGSLDLTTVPEIAVQASAEDIRIQKAMAALPPPRAALNLDEIESLAHGVLTNVAYSYYASAGDDEYSLRENRYAFTRYWFRPRVMNKISVLDTRSTMLGFPTSLPVYISPAALARLGHPGGEVNIVRAAAQEGVIQGVSINASCSLDEIADAKEQDQTLMFQIYLDRNRQNSEKLLRKVEEKGFKALMLTVDSAVPGNRERDQRAKGSFEAPANNGGVSSGSGVAQAISGYQDPDITWDDIAWIRSITTLPLVLKGMQCVEDIEKAHQHGVAGVIISNHGGRSLDFSPPPIDILHELSQKRPDLCHNPKFEVYVDGGVRRGTDVLKALCLGAKGVGLGRSVLYGNSAWGEEGVRRVIEIIRQEVETGMRLLGVTRLEDLKPELVRRVDRDPAPFSRNS